MCLLSLLLLLLFFQQIVSRLRILLFRQEIVQLEFASPADPDAVTPRFGGEFDIVADDLLTMFREGASWVFDLHRRQVI